MSLDVLLQAAQFVDHNQKTDQSNQSTGVRSYGSDVHGAAASVSQEYEIKSQERLSPFPSTGAEGANCSSPSKSDSFSDASLLGSYKIKRKKRPTPQNQETEKAKRGRAHLKDCFESLKLEVMESDDDKKASHLAVLKSAVRCIQQLQRQTEQLQRDTERTLKEKNSSDQRLLDLKTEVLSQNPSSELMTFIGMDDEEEENDSQATCTAPGSPGLQMDCYRDNHFSKTTASSLELSSSNLTSTPSVYTSSSSTSGTNRKRKKTSRNAETKPPSSKKPPIKSVTEILQETRHDLPVSPQPVSPPVMMNSCRSPVDCLAKKSLPIRLRILQDQQDGLFKDSHYCTPDTSAKSPVLSVAEVSSSSSECPDNPTAEPSHPPLPTGFTWPADFAAFPFYGRSGYTLPMFPVNQLFLPVSTSANNAPGSGQLVMMPAAAASALVNDLYHRTYQQRPPSPP